MDDDGFELLLERVKRLTGLSARDAAKVAYELDGDPTEVLPQQIIEKAIELDLIVDEPAAPQDDAPTGPSFGAGINMNPVEVLSEVYMLMPRVLSQEIPKLGKVPDEARKHFEGLDELPDEMVAMLVKIDVFEGKATFWLKDEANDVDRPLGPIDLSPYDSERALMEALTDLMRRLPLVLSADFN